MRFMRAHAHNSPRVRFNRTDRLLKGEGSWWSYVPVGLPRGAHGRMDNTESWARVQDLLDHLQEYDLVEFVSRSEPARPGDLVFLDLNGTDLHDLNHVQVVTQVRGHKIEVAQHSTDYKQRFSQVRSRLERDLGVLGFGWDYWIYRPTHTAANIG